MGRYPAKLSVSALMFDYILTGRSRGFRQGSISSASFTTVTYSDIRGPFKSDDQLLAAGLAVLVTFTSGGATRKASTNHRTMALKDHVLTTVMMVLLIGWWRVNDLETAAMPALAACGPSRATSRSITMPWVVAQNHPGALGNSPFKRRQPRHPRLANSGEPLIRSRAQRSCFVGLIGILIAFGHSFWRMSGEESLAQVNRELEYPKHRNWCARDLSSSFTHCCSVAGFVSSPMPSSLTTSGRLFRQPDQRYWRLWSARRR